MHVQEFRLSVSYLQTVYELVKSTMSNVTYSFKTTQTVRTQLVKILEASN